MSVRFSPEECPGCGEPLRPKYSTYRQGARSWLFPVGIVGGGFAVLALLALAFLGGLAIAGAIARAAGLNDREMGLLALLCQIPLFALVALGARVGWGMLHRLPRTFESGCGTCTWTGPCKVYESGEQISTELRG
jgi:hypothetical protein